MSERLFVFECVCLRARMWFSLQLVVYETMRISLCLLTMSFEWHYHLATSDERTQFSPLLRHSVQPSDIEEYYRRSEHLTDWSVECGQ